MTQVSRPLLVALAAAVLLLGVWMVALKPSGSGTAANPTPSAPGVKGLANAIDKAHAAVAASNGASLAHGGTITPTSTLSTPSATTSLAPPTTQGEASARESSQTAIAQPRPAPRTSPTAGGSPGTRLDAVTRALQSGKALALLFFSPSGADDQAVKQELQSIPVLGGRVVKLAIPISELSNYPVVTSQVPINESPTLVIVNRSKQATTIVGFADTLEISQRISDAVA